MTLKSALPPSASRPATETKRLPKIEGLKQVLNSVFDFTTILLIGAFLQGLILLLIPGIWGLLPTIFVLCSRAITTYSISKGWLKNPYTNGSIPKVTALAPDYDGEFSTIQNPSSEKITVFLLGLRINHPMGLFDPYAAKINEYNSNMAKALDKGAPDNGFLGQSVWFSKAASGGQDILLISYWRRAEDVLAFSQGPEHKAAWNWWEDNIKDVGHIGISHEQYEADRAMWENIYINFQPTRLGATSFFRRGDEMIGGSVPDQWISPLVDASRGKLRMARGRLGWSSTDAAHQDENEYTDEKQAFY